MHGAIEFEPVIRVAMALDRKKKTLPAGSYCPGCGVRQELKKHSGRGSVGPVHFHECSYVNYEIIEVDASLRDDLGGGRDICLPSHAVRISSLLRPRLEGAAPALAVADPHYSVALPVSAKLDDRLPGFVF